MCVFSKTKDGRSDRMFAGILPSLATSLTFLWSDDDGHFARLIQSRRAAKKHKKGADRPMERTTPLFPGTGMPKHPGAQSQAQS